MAFDPSDSGAGSASVGPVRKALGPRPREALSALVAYGLDDPEIAAFRGLPAETVARLRALWNIEPRP